MPMRCLINFGFRHPGFVIDRVHVLLSLRKKERKKDRFRNPFFRFDRKFVSTMDKFMVTLLNALLISLTVIGNVVVLAAMIKTPSLRSPSNIVFCIGIGQYMSSILYCWRVRKQLLSKQAEEN